jgi:threonine/homoserine/homoserine lactone efflux protein
MLEQILLIAGVTALCMLSPGPDMALVARNSLVRGRRFGLGSDVGILAGNLIHCGYCLVGIGVLISRSIVAFNLLKWAGAA